MRPIRYMLYTSGIEVATGRVCILVVGSEVPVGLVILYGNYYTRDRDSHRRRTVNWYVPGWWAELPYPLQAADMLGEQ